MVIITIIVIITKGNKMKNLRFSRQVNYPDLAHNIQYLIYKLKAEGRSGWEGLDILDLAYRAESKTYKNFSIKYAAAAKSILDKRSMNQVIDDFNVARGLA